MKDRIEVVEKIMSENERLALENLNLLNTAGILGLNLMASPGAGKTSLIENTLGALSNRTRIAVIDGDIATSIDADRAVAAGAIAVQINTGGQCHLDAVMLREALTLPGLVDEGHRLSFVILVYSGVTSVQYYAAWTQLCPTHFF